MKSQLLKEEWRALANPGYARYLHQLRPESLYSEYQCWKRCADQVALRCYLSRRARHASAVVCDRKSATSHVVSSVKLQIGVERERERALGEIVVVRVCFARMNSTLVCFLSTLASTCLSPRWSSTRLDDYGLRGKLASNSLNQHV